MGTRVFLPLEGRRVLVGLNVGTNAVGCPVVGIADGLLVVGDGVGDSKGVILGTFALGQKRALIKYDSIKLLVAGVDNNSFKSCTFNPDVVTVNITLDPCSQVSDSSIFTNSTLLGGMFAAFSIAFLNPTLNLSEPRLPTGQLQSIWK